MQKKNYLRKTLAIVMAFLMIVTMMPVNVMAQEPQIPGTSTRAVDPEGKPPVDWDKDVGEGRDDGSTYWSLPAGVKVVNAHNGPDPVNTFGFTYLGKYTDDGGRIVLKFEVSHRATANSGVWAKYVMRFPKELYQYIDKDKSFALWKQTEVYRIDNFDKLISSDIPNQQAYTLQFPYRGYGAQYVHREINVVLKDDINWEKDFKNKSQVIQLRLYNSDGSKIYSTSARKANKKFTSFGYNTHTKTAVVGDLSKRPGDLMESTTISMADPYNDVFHTADSTLQLDKENKKVRIIYTIAKKNTTAPVGTPNSEYKFKGEDLALRQTLDPEFVRYLNLSDPNAKIGTFRLYLEDETAAKDGLKLSSTDIDIFASDLNGVKLNAQGQIELDENNNPTYTRDDQSVFIQISTKDFKDKENAEPTNPNYIKSKQTAGINFYDPHNNGNGLLGVFEYDIDPDKINATMIKNKEFSKNFMFDTRYITSNNGGMRKYTGVATTDIIYRPDVHNFYIIRPEKYTSITTSVAGNNSAEDIVLNIDGPNGIWKSWKREGAAWFNEGKKDYAISTYGKEFHMTNHPIAIGGKIKAGTPITVYIPKDNSKGVNQVLFDVGKAGPKSGKQELVGQTSYTGSNFITLTKETKADGSDIFYNPMYIKNTVSTIGGSAIREQYTPIVDEIFTDSTEFTGIMRTEGGVRSSLYKPQDNGTTKEHFGENWLDSESDEDGNITSYERTDGKIQTKDDKSETISPDDILEERVAKGLDEKNKVVDKTFKGFKFNIKKLYTGGDDFKNSNDKTTVGEFGLIKDQPVMFNSFRTTSLQSAPVYEQVQAKVKFMLYPAKKVSLDKIVPLNTKYSIEPEKLNADGLEEITRLQTTGKPNIEYKPNGFKAKDGENNIRVDEKEPTVKVKRISLTETNSFSKEKEVTYPNFLNHDGYAYGVNSTDQAIKDRAISEFIKRLYPDAEFDAALSSEADGSPRTDGKVVIGWTTKELKDTATKSAADLFYDLEKDKKVLTNIADWKKVDDKVKPETFIFNEYSPVDKHRTVYAVWGTPSLVLHSNNTFDTTGNFDPSKETVVRIPYTKDDIDKTTKIIDAMTSATKETLKNNNVIKELPLAPYRYTSKQLGEKYDSRLDSFIMENSTFVGWTLKRYTNDKNSEFVAGNNNERLGEIQNGQAKNGKSLPVRTESAQYLSGKRDAYVPNGYNFAVSKGYNDLMKAGKDIHLYANYRPNFEIKVKPRYMNIAAKDATHQYGKYDDTVDASKKKAIKIALIYRTAVTNYSEPTVLQGATYNPLVSKDLSQGDEVIKNWDGTSDTTLTWNAPGFDREGMRQSYVAVVVPEGKEDVYKNFKSAKPSGGIYDWTDLGIDIYVKLNGQSYELDKKAPRNLHETVSKGDPYGVGLAKEQTFTVKTGTKLDAFTSATSRQSVVRNTPDHAEEVKGYNIILTNTPQSIPKPDFNSVKDTDKTISINFGSELVAEKLKELRLKVPMTPDGKTVTHKDIKFTIAEDGKTFTSTDGYIAVLDENTGKLTIENFDFSNLPAGETNRTIYGTYVNKSDLEGEQSKVVITQVLPSNPVTNMEQIAKTDGEEARIKFTIPKPGPTDQVVPGTKYTAQKFDKDTNQWVDVGTFEVTGRNEAGTDKEMPLNGVKHDDIIRIKSEEPGKLVSYSVGDETSGAYTPTPQDPNDTTNPPADTGHYVKLDLVAPEIKGEAKDETFRRYIDLRATFDEILKQLPEQNIGDKIKVEFGTAGKRGADGNKVMYFKDKGQLLEEIGVVERTPEMEDITGIWVSVVDRYGNETKEKDAKGDPTDEGKLYYEQTYQLRLDVFGARPNVDYLRIKSDKANTSITLTFLRGGQEQGKQTLTVQQAKKFEKFTLELNGVNYKLEKGDEIIVEGTATDGVKTYTNNPFKVLVR